MNNMANYNGNKPNRKIYVRGKRDKIDLYITNYVDDVTLNWINSRAVVTSAIWELVRREAYREAAIYGQNLGASNNDIQGVPDINQVVHTAQSNQNNLKPPQEVAKGNSDSGKLNMDSKKTNKDNNTTGKVVNDGNGSPKGNPSPVIINSDIVPSAEENKVVESEVAATDENKNIKINENADSKEKNNKGNDNNDGKLNLNAQFKKKKKVSTLKGQERTNFNSTKPNKIEMETLGLSEQ